MDIDKFRQIHLSIAEGLDAWRVVPRVLVALYCYMLYKIIEWYMTLEPHIINNCVSQTVTDLHPYFFAYSKPARIILRDAFRVTILVEIAISSLGTSLKNFIFG